MYLKPRLWVMLQMEQLRLAKMNAHTRELNELKEAARSARTKALTLQVMPTPTKPRH